MNIIELNKAIAELIATSDCEVDFAYVLLNKEDVSINRKGDPFKLAGAITYLIYDINVYAMKGFK